MADAIVTLTGRQAVVISGATLAQSYANEAKAARDDILDDAGFIAVSDDLTGDDTIGTVATNIAAVQAADTNMAAIIAAPAAATSAQGYADAAASSAAILGGASRFSQIPHKASDANSDVAWISRNSLGNVARADVALQTAANYQLLISSFTSPATRVTGSVVSSKLRVTSNLAANFATGAAVTYKALADRTIKGGGKVINGVGTAASRGLGPIFTGAVPTPGGATAVMNADAVFLCLRSNGAVVAYQRDGTTVASGVTITGSSTTAWSDGQVITWAYQGTSTTGGVLAFYADGDLLQTCTVSGLPSEAYVMNGIRWSSTDTVELVDLAVSEASLDIGRRIHLDPNNAGAAVGTEANPFTTLADAIEACDIDSYRREIEIVLKAGVYRGTLSFNADRWRRIRVRGAKGHGAIIRPSFALSGAVWTQIGSTEEWYAANRWGTAINSLQGFGGLVETTAGITQAFGRTGLVTVSNRRLLTKRSVGTPAGTLSRGEYTVHQSSTYAGKVIVRCHDGGDPNSKTWEQMAYRYGVAAVGSSASGWNGCSFEVADLRIDHPMTYGLYGKLVNAIVENVSVLGTGESFGFEFDECNLRAMGCLVEGSYGDGYHSAGGLSSDANRRLPVHIYDDCDSMGAFTSTLGAVGDAWSNHAGHRYFLNNCRAWSSGKDGISAIDEFRLNNFDARDNVNAGVSLAPGASATLGLSSVFGGKLVGNNIGAVLNFGANNNITASLDLDRVTMQDNVRSSAETFSSGTGCTGALNARDCRTITTGAAPTQGHKKVAGLAINTFTSADL